MRREEAFQARRRRPRLMFRKNLFEYVVGALGLDQDGSCGGLSQDRIGKKLLMVFVDLFVFIRVIRDQNPSSVFSVCSVVTQMLNSLREPQHLQHK